MAAMVCSAVRRTVPLIGIVVRVHGVLHGHVLMQRGACHNVCAGSVACNFSKTCRHRRHAQRHGDRSHPLGGNDEGDQPNRDGFDNA